MIVSAIKNTLLKQQIYSKIPAVGAVQNVSSKNLLSLFLFASSNASFEKCHFYLILSFVLSRKIININNNIARKYGNVTVKNFRKYEKLEQKRNKQKFDIDFLNNCKQFDVYPKLLIFKLPNVSNKDDLLLLHFFITHLVTYFIITM